MKEMHQQELLQTQLEIQTQTMQHIGTEIHDNVGQKLTLASLYSKQLNAGSANLEEKINAISKIIDESLAELRRLSKTLTDPELANAGLVELLTGDAARINASGVCFVDIGTQGQPVNLTAAKKNILFRLLQEFIQNSLKHAACRKININIINSNGLLEITANDDGKGFDMTQPAAGIGLQNMKRRAQQLNTRFELTSEPGKGTSLNLAIQTD
jgi:signal transduction histidine kinase